VIIKTPKGEMTNNNAATREANLDNKLKITLGGLAMQPQMPENEVISLANKGNDLAGGTLN